MMFFFTSTAHTAIYTLSLHDALPISKGNNRSSQGSLRDRFKALRMREEAGITIGDEMIGNGGLGITTPGANNDKEAVTSPRSEEHTSELQSHVNLVCRLLLEKKK